MPCTYYETPREIAERQERHAQDRIAVATLRLRESLGEREAMLCAILSLMSKAMTEEELGHAILKIDAKEAGVTPQQILLWWSDHKKKDQKRRKTERKTRRIPDCG